VERINLRYQHSPYSPWGARGELPDAGLLIHCFDGHEEDDAPWLPRSVDQGGGPSTLVSASLIFAEQCRNDPRAGGYPGYHLFGHSCANGGIVFRPRVANVLCGNPGDAGGYCHRFCPPTEGGGACGYATGQDRRSWAPADVHVYLQRETLERNRGAKRNNRYNEFVLDGQQWAAQLPGIIDAFLAPNMEGTTHDAHRKFLERYSLTAEDVPSLVFTCDCASPFVAGGLVSLDPCRRGG